MEKAKSRKKSAKSPRAATVAEAFHIHNDDGTQHIVGVKALHVLLTQDGDGWFAQGLEIDYAASGDQIDDVKKNFGDGLRATVDKHLEMFGSIEKMLVPAPGAAWKEYLAASPQAIRQGFTSISMHVIDRQIEGTSETEDFPFESIQFLNLNELIRRGSQRAALA